MKTLSFSLIMAFILAGCSDKEISPNLKPVELLYSISEKTIVDRSFIVEQEFLLEYNEHNEISSSNWIKTNSICTSGQDCISHKMTEILNFPPAKKRNKAAEIVRSDFSPDMKYSYDNGKLVNVTRQYSGKVLEYRLTYDKNRLISLTVGFEDNPNLIYRKEFRYKEDNIETLVIHDLTQDKTSTIRYTYDDQINPFYGFTEWQAILNVGFGETSTLPDVEARVFSRNNVKAAQINEVKGDATTDYSRNYSIVYDEEGYPRTFTSTSTSETLRIDITYIDSML